MLRALELAEAGQYLPAPNPRVGCVIERGGQVLGEGCSQAAGSHHAEAMALLQARAAGHDVAGAHAWVTLEPCSHMGRTPPCADALIAARLARVTVALVDPNPLVAGRGIARLRQAGVAVDLLPAGDALARRAYELNIGFCSRMLRARPWTRLKIAASLDGLTALADGRSQWITGVEARRDGHHFRARACGTLTGVGTVLADDPQLTVRLVDTPRQPRRYLVDARLQSPDGARLLREGGPVTVFCADAREPARVERLRARGHRLVELPDAQGKVDLAAMLTWLSEHDACNELHVEAGFKLNGSLLRSGLVDELLLYLAPKLLGQGLGLAALAPPERLDLAPVLHWHEQRLVGDDLRIMLRTASGAAFASAPPTLG
jgi:diaminohydroxyphosphoribosylaminopyrimidine deaminase/5-amino-6-(5-phosphoribosylamino)uracil reductase